MRRKEKILFNVLLGTGLYLLDSFRDRLANNMGDLGERARDSYGDLRSRAKDFYSTASDRLDRASDVVRGEDHRILATTGAVLLGVGVGFGVGMLFAPASGEETRNKFADRVRERFSEKKQATGTYGK